MPVAARIKRFLQDPFPYYLGSDQKNLWFSAGLAAFVTLNLTVFLPMEWIHIQKWIITGLIIFAVLYSHIVWLPKIFPKHFVPENWTVGKYMLATFWQLVVIGWLASVLLYTLGLYPGYDFDVVVFYYFVNMVMYGSVSIIVFTFIIRTVMLQTNLRLAMKANDELRRTMPPTRHDTTEELAVVTIQSDTSDRLTLSPDQLLYIEADDNYATFHWLENDTVTSKMIRGNLKSIASQIVHPHIVRCHRSFLVNAAAIAGVEGNTNGYRLSLRNTDAQVPLSRSKGPEVLQLLERLRMASTQQPTSVDVAV